MPVATAVGLLAELSEAFNVVSMKKGKTVLQARLMFRWREVWPLTYLFHHFKTDSSQTLLGVSNFATTALLSIRVNGFVLLTSHRSALKEKVDR